MGVRGRKSASDLVVVQPLETVPRPDAPYDLTDEQSREWWAVVNRLPADWFPRETHPILAQYCRHIVRARRLAELIGELEKSESFDVKEYRDLLRSEEEQSRAIASLATKMRISQQSTYDEKKKKPNPAKQLWQRSGGA